MGVGRKVRPAASGRGTTAREHRTGGVVLSVPGSDRGYVVDPGAVTFDRPGLPYVVCVEVEVLDGPEPVVRAGSVTFTPRTDGEALSARGVTRCKVGHLLVEAVEGQAQVVELAGDDLTVRWLGSAQVPVGVRERIRRSIAPAPARRAGRPCKYDDAFLGRVAEVWRGDPRSRALVDAFPGEFEAGLPHRTRMERAKAWKRAAHDRGFV